MKQISKTDSNTSMEMVRLSKPVPDMEFEAFHDGEIRKYRFSDFRGRWLIVVFYPADFTFVCPTELEDFADNYDEFRAAGAEIVSFSTDTVYAHKVWKEISSAVKKVRFPMGADPTGRISRVFGVYNEETGLAERGTFIIDPDGVVRSIEIVDGNIGRNASETLRKLKALQWVREHRGEVCPAKWEPGKQTLKVNISLAGKI